MIAHACASLGWSWEQAEDELTLPRWKVLNAYWRRHPPVHQLVAAFMGYKEPEEPQKITSPDEFANFLKASGVNRG